MIKLFNLKSKIKAASWLLLIIILTLGLSISFQSLLAAWSTPAGNPPTCAAGTAGCDAPLNDSTTSQIKSGTLQVNGFRNIGSSIFDGSVGIGLTDPTGAKLQVSASAGNLLLLQSGATDKFKIDISGDIRASKTIYKDTSGNVIIQLGN